MRQYRWLALLVLFGIVSPAVACGDPLGPQIPEGEDDEDDDPDGPDDQGFLLEFSSEPILV